jgi:peptidoglycan/LPS O-acetylase OafA/YrhL
LATGAVMAILAIMLSGVHGPASDLVAVATAVLIAFYRDTAGLPRVLLTNRMALFLGTISYQDIPRNAPPFGAIALMRLAFCL